MRDTNIILVDLFDNPKGITTKIVAHRDGLLHRAFSVFIFNTKGELLIQKRSKEKYHSGGLWSNACCSHPNPSNDIRICVLQRLKEELGIVNVDINEIDNFVYRSKLDDDLYEYEFDHIFYGISDDLINLNMAEVMEYKWVSQDWICNDVADNPNQYTVWFITSLPIVIKYLINR